MSVRRVAAVVVALAASLASSPAAAKPPEPVPLEVRGEASSFVVPPAGKGPRPLIVWLHGRGGDPRADCEKWSRVTVELGWLLCVSGPEARGGGARGWHNNWASSKRSVDAAVAAFLDKHKKRVKPGANVLIGFSEGALVAMNVGVREPELFPRWLILAANDVYWGGDGAAELARNKKQIKRVYLLTGEKDMVVDSTRRVFASLERERVKARIWTPDDIGHEVPEDRMRTFYRKPLLWLLGQGK